MNGSGDGHDRPGDEEAMLGRLERDEPARSPEEAEARQPYLRLRALFAELPCLEPPAGWEQRVEAACDRARPAATCRLRRRRLLSLVGTGMALAAAVLLLVLRPPPRESELEIAIAHAGSPRRGASATIGDEMRIRASMDAPHVEVRVYRNDQAVLVRCPGSARCAREDKGWSVAVLLSAPGRYRAIVAASELPLAPPGPHGLEADLEGFLAARARIEQEVVNVE